jgi:hypothetical protein
MFKKHSRKRPAIKELSGCDLNTRGSDHNPMMKPRTPRPIPASKSKNSTQSGFGFVIVNEL